MKWFLQQPGKFLCHGLLRAIPWAIFKFIPMTSICFHSNNYHLITKWMIIQILYLPSSSCNLFEILWITELGDLPIRTRENNTNIKWSISSFYLYRLKQNNNKKIEAEINSIGLTKNLILIYPLISSTAQIICQCLSSIASYQNQQLVRATPMAKGLISVLKPQVTL